MHQPGKPLSDLAYPGIDDRQRAGIPRGSGFKNRAAIGQAKPGLLGAAHQRGGGSVALVTADGPAGAGHAVQRVEPEVSQLAAKAPGTLQQAAAGQDAAAHAGAQRNADHIGIAFGCTGPDFAQQHAVGIVGNGDGQAKLAFQRTFDVHTDPAGKVAAGAGYHAAAAVDLAGGGYADASQRRGIVGGDKVPDGGGDGVQNRRFVAVKADAALGAGYHLPVLVHQAQLDRRAPDVNA